MFEQKPFAFQWDLKTVAEIISLLITIIFVIIHTALGVTFDEKSLNLSVRLSLSLAIAATTASEIKNSAPCPACLYSLDMEAVASLSLFSIEKNLNLLSMGTSPTSLTSIDSSNLSKVRRRLGCISHGNRSLTSRKN